MIDPFGRHIDYLRVSVTDRCDFRCHYCMSEEMTFLPKEEILTLEELERACDGFIARGVKKIRITGGEPLGRRNVMTLFRHLSQHLDSGALSEVTLTTNASRLAKYAQELYDYGVRRVNVSLDSLRPDRFRAITRNGDLATILDGLAVAKSVGLKIKINAVALKGENDDEFKNLIAWCGEEGFDLTLIETMPLGEIGGDRVDQYLPLNQVQARLAETWTLTPSDHQTNGPSRYFDVAETGGRIGFITPLTEHFCDTCNRMRLTCTGTLFMCLGQDSSIDLRGPMRGSESDAALLAAIDKAVGLKPKGHEFVIDQSNGGPALNRHMSVTGG